MKDVIDVQAREVKRKFLTGTPAWADGALGKVYLAVVGGCALWALYGWVFK